MVPLMLGASMFETAVPGEVPRLEYARFLHPGGDHSPTLGKAVTRALTLRPSRAVVRVPPQWQYTSQLTTLSAGHPGIASGNDLLTASV